MQHGVVVVGGDVRGELKGFGGGGGGVSLLRWV